VHKEALVDLGVKPWVSISCASVNSRVNTQGSETPTQAYDNFLKVLLANQKAVWGGVFSWAEQKTFFVKRVEKLQYHLNSKTRNT
jgi:hypothetical protein